MKAITRDISSNIISVIFRIYIRFDDDSQKSCIIYLTYCLTVDKKLMGLLHFFFKKYAFYIEGQLVNVEP